MLIVPHTCPDVPAMREMPVIMYNEDQFNNPEFHADFVLDIDDEIDTKLQIADLNVSQVYQWLPYTFGEEAPADPKERFEWLKGMNITADTTDKEVMAATRGYAVDYAKVAARFRKELIKKYGRKRGRKIRYAEAYELCEYGAPLTEELRKALIID